MAKYKITFKKSVAKDLRNIPKRDVKRILKRIDALAEDPRSSGCIKLSGLDRYRIRLGLYRVIYEIDDSIILVLILKVGNRKDIYKK